MKKIVHMEEHWSLDSQRYQDIDQEGLALVCYVGMPLWFNRFMDVFQKRTVRFLTRKIPLRKKRILDLGTGVGRWVGYFETYTDRSRITGVDIESKRLSKARKRFPKAHFMKANIENLPFRDESFDLVNSVTVLQHMPYKAKDQAIQEIARVTKKGGYVLLVELIDMKDTAKHVFPLRMQEWIGKFRKCGFKVVRRTGYEYIFILRLLRLIQGVVKGHTIIPKSEGKVLLKPWEWTILRIVVWISYPLELIASWFLPVQWARHVGVLLKKS